jgi:hypothetical protein
VLSQASIIDGKPVVGVDLDQLIYFAVSVFWRAGARKWDALDHSTQISLGPYQEQLRKFLLGQEPFPDRAALLVNVTTNVTPQLSATFPYSDRANGVRQHRFSLPGMAFWLHLGRIQEPLRYLCAAHSGVICYTKTLDANYEREMGSLVRTAKPSTALLKGLSESS